MSNVFPYSSQSGCMRSSTFLSQTNMNYPAPVNMISNISLPKSKHLDVNGMRVSNEEFHADYVALHVAGLGKAVKNDDLFKLFDDAGMKIVSVKVCHDFFTHDTLGYGYVNFYDYREAATAVEKLDNTMCNGHHIRLTWNIPDSEVRKNSIGKLFLKNLAPSIGERRLYEIFSRSGKILSVKVARRADRASLGYGHVQFASQDVADTVVKNFNDTIVDGKKLLVNRYARSECTGNRQDKFNNLYIKNIDTEIDEIVIRLKFSEFGPISSVKIVKDEEGNPKGFGFVCFEKPENARNAMEKMHGRQLENKTLYVARAMQKAEITQLLLPQKLEWKMKTKHSNLYIKNLSQTIDDTVLHEYFSQCGKITSAKVMCMESGVSRGFGFVCYSSAQEAQNAIAMFNGRCFHGKELYVALADKKDERRLKLANLIAAGTFVPASALYQPNKYCTSSSYAPYDQSYSSITRTQINQLEMSWLSGVYFTSTTAAVANSPMESPGEEIMEQAH